MGSMTHNADHKGIFENEFFASAKQRAVFIIHVDPLCLGLYRRQRIGETRLQHLAMGSCATTLGPSSTLVRSSHSRQF